MSFMPSMINTFSRRCLDAVLNEHLFSLIDRVDGAFADFFQSIAAAHAAGSQKLGFPSTPEWLWQ